MSEAHDLPSGTLDGSSGSAVRGDPLSDVLRSVRLNGALFFLVDATSPWCVDIPPAGRFRDIIMPRAQHIVSYHIMLEGGGYASVPGRPRVWMEAGDIVVFPHGDAYLMESEPGAEPEFDADGTMKFFRLLASGALPFTVTEGGGQDPRSTVICGFLGCDILPFNPLLDSMPPLLHVRGRQGREGDLLDQLVTMTIREAQAEKAGGASIRLGLSELLFVEVLRRHLADPAAEQGGWLAGLRDPAVGRALQLIHNRPEQDWSIAGLAREAAVSRSVLAERFAALTGTPVMRYLTLWRMQIASRSLVESPRKVAAIAADVGYASEAAFSRAFKKTTGLSPSRWRERNGGAGLS